LVSRASVEAVEDLDRGPELDARVAAPPGPAQALAVAQQGAGVLEGVRRPFLEADRFLEVGVIGPAAGAGKSRYPMPGMRQGRRGGPYGGAPERASRSR
jgi:hypothetical protein